MTFSTSYTIPSAEHAISSAWGWLDLLSAFPVIHEFRFVRIFRIVRIVRLINSFNEFRLFVKLEKKSSIYAFILVLITFIIVSTSFLVLYLEKGVGNIQTAEDTLWWAYITVTTVGYGDYYPVTIPGKGGSVSTYFHRIYCFRYDYFLRE